MWLKISKTRIDKAAAFIKAVNKEILQPARNAGHIRGATGEQRKFEEEICIPNFEFVSARDVSYL
jgi:hypothetical protein